MPWVIELRVVSLPATASMITKKPNSSSESFSPSMSAWISVVTMSSVGFLPRSSAMAIAYMISSIDDCAGSTSAYSGSSPPVISLDQRNSLSRSSCGTPSRPAMACSGSSHDTCSTKSPAALGGRGLGDVLGALREFLLQPSDGAGRETAGDDLAQPGVVRRVHVEHDVALQLDLLALSSPSARSGWRRSASWRRRRCAATPP